MDNAIQNLVDLHGVLKTTNQKVRRPVTTINPTDSNEWIYDSQSIRHRTGGFFRIVGLRFWSSRTQKFLVQPIIDQPEIGVLAFAIRGNLEAREILIQTKCEPGNVGAVQIAPTCQATQSNLNRLHGGIEPPGVFIKNDLVVSDSLHSEQGTRFWHKQNQNLVVTSSPEMKVSNTDFGHLHWIPVSVFRQSLGFSFLTNTDARSVMVTTNWETVMGVELFEARTPSDSLGKLLARAWKIQTFEQAQCHAEKVLSWLTVLRQQEWISKPVSLSDVTQLHVGKHGLLWSGATSSFNIRHVSVSIRGRECEIWDQPLIDSHTTGEVTLLAFEKEGNVAFIFRAETEPGLKNQIELSASISRSPGTKPSSKDKAFLRLARAGTVLKSIKQSDEGGRFWRDVTTYRIVLIQNPGDLPAQTICLSLREISVLAPKSVFTNEARSVISLLLSLPV